jgi:hypothetical protein
MNLEQLPTDIKNDIEDQSLSILDKIKDRIIVIGGWAVRAHLGEDHHRYTLDVDGVTDEKNLEVIREEMEEFGFEAYHSEWGIQFMKRYEPNVPIPETLREEIEKIQIRIEISKPMITEFHTPHFFEFSLIDFDIKGILFHDGRGEVMVKVPPIEHMAAVKLGLPVDYKNNHDAAMLLQRSDIELVIKAILENDDWKEMVLRRMPKLKGRISQSGQLENTLAFAAGLNIKEHIRRLDIIEEALKK